MSAVLHAVDLRPHPAGEPWESVPHASWKWSDRFGAVHTVAASGLLVALSLAWLLRGSGWASTTGAGAVLVGGALIGVPHGSSDFLVAHRLFRPALGWLWLPGFAAGYLALVGAVLAAWWVAPLATLLSFLLISGLHFGAEDLDASGLTPTWWRRLARATTPLVPIVTLHLSAVAPFFATMTGRGPGAILAVFEPVRLPMLAAWIVVAAGTTLADLSASGRARRLEGCELLALALAAAVLPPLVTFAVYFCLVHAVRHMAGLAASAHPRDGARAWRLAAVVVVPSACVCLAALAASWSAIAGVIETDALLCFALQLVAALTVPHMLLELLAERDAGHALRRA